MTNFPYRKGANAIVIDQNNNFLIVQKNKYGDDEWDFPGGGLEEDEDPKDGVLRELYEELGSDDFQIIKESPFMNRFEWPKDAQEAGYAKHGKWWRGQEKHQFIVKFMGNKEALVLQKEEIKKIKWVPYKDLKDHLIFKEQWDKAKEVIEEAEIDF